MLTSRIAKEELEETGVLARQRLVVLNPVWDYSNCTSAEIAARSGLDRHVIARRLPELEKMGQVERSIPRRCTVTGRMGYVWSPVVS
jgi:DNA-binding MarR family transcriptional regulator